ncbi:hypothetical protein RN001_008810 [Aquatica leii]|uniref:Uncharacterized protein n=1 Tax=Aquatica leii TaxID=1421715 RepID=A0AAN7SHF3_9COLE|nr:hypothetical protein RN001_008810 [Aquatica leii]
MELKSHQVVFIVVYAPNDDATVVKKDLFYQELTKVIDNIADRKELIILGYWIIVGQYGENVENDNGDRLIELCQQQALKITNGWFKHKNIHRYTWTQPTRQLKSIIDYIVVRQQFRPTIKDVRVWRGAECGSDHHLLVSKIMFKFRHMTAAQQDDESNDELNDENGLQYNLDSLKDDSTLFLYKLRLAQKLSEIPDDSANN